MFIDLKTLTRLPVSTESGVYLGRARNIELDTDTHQVRRYSVGLGWLGRNSHLISPSQIKSISADKIVVEDAVIKVKQPKEKRLATPSPVLGSVMPASEDVK